MLESVRRACTEFADRQAFCIRGEFHSYRDFAAMVCGLLDRVGEDLADEPVVGIFAYDDVET